MNIQIEALVSEILACKHCKDDLPYAPKPIFQLNQKSKILIVGQAPGLKAHHSGKPFDDASGIRLRRWLNISETVFYDASKVAILPMAFCYPGRGKAGDLPPRSECALQWRELIMPKLPDVSLTIVIGQYAYAYYYPNSKKSLTEAVRFWKQDWPQKIVLPHPSPRNNIWLKKNPWFEQEVIPALQDRIKTII